MWRDVFNRIGSREVIGVLEITKENNPKIIDATNRQDFVDNKEYQDLKDFIIEQLNVFSGVKIFEREKRKYQAESEFKKASTVWPESVRPLASVIVPEIITGISIQRNSQTSSIAIRAAFALRVSKMVSTISRSTPPSINPST